MGFLEKLWKNVKKHRDIKLHFIHWTDDICKYIAEDFKTRFHTSDYELDRLLPKEKK